MDDILGTTDNSRHLANHMFGQHFQVHSHVSCGFALILVVWAHAFARLVSWLQVHMYFLNPPRISVLQQKRKHFTWTTLAHRKNNFSRNKLEKIQIFSKLTALYEVLADVTSIQRTDAGWIVEAEHDIIALPEFKLTLLRVPVLHCDGETVRGRVVGVQRDQVRGRTAFFIGAEQAGRRHHWARAGCRSTARPATTGTRLASVII